MSGAAYVARGASTGQAPTTVFFPPIPSKYNLLLQLYSFNEGGGVFGTTFLTQLFSCDNINQWVQWDTNWGGGGGSHLSASIGATVTAPDGTATGYHVTEGTNNGYHLMVAGNPEIRPAKYRRRLAVFAKAAERTRLYLAMADNLNLTNDSGIYCVFDLAGGQIGVPLTTYGGFAGLFVPVTAGMVPYGNGWYLCYIDSGIISLAAFQSGVMQGCVGPDSGSGTGALSVKYAGDGASGIYCWKTNMMPPRAWNMSGTVSFFDDFNDNTMAEIDVAGTGAAGFQWYPLGCTNSAWTQNGFSPNFTSTLTGRVSVSGSVCTLPASNNPFPNMASAANKTPPAFVGNAFTPPFLMELRSSYQYSLNSTELAWGNYTIDQLQQFNAPAQTGIGQEVDWIDAGGASGVQPIFAVFSPNFELDYNMTPWMGYSVWQPGITYSNGFDGVYWNGVVYHSIHSANLNNQPDISPTFWSVSTPDSTHPQIIANNQIVDFNNMQNWAFLHLPDRSKYDNCDTGSYTVWFNGVPCLPGILVPMTIYGSQMGDNTLTQNPQNFALLQAGDNYKFILYMGASRNSSISTDYWRVTQ